MSIWSSFVTFSDRPGLGDPDLGPPYAVDYSLEDRGGSFDVASTWFDGLRFIIRDPEAPSDGPEDDAACVLDAKQVKRLHEGLGKWLREHSQPESGSQ